MTGTVGYLNDSWGAGEVREDGQTSAVVQVGLRGDGARDFVVDFASGGSDDDFTVSRTPDGRLTTVSFKSVGIGGRVVTAGATLVAYVAGIAGRIAGIPRAEGVPPVEGPPPKAPEQKARDHWNKLHPLEASLYERYRALVTTQSSAVASHRETAAAAPNRAEQVAALASARRAERILAASQREVDRLDGMYRAWRGTTVSRRTESRSYDLSLGRLPEFTGAAPDPATFTDPSRTVWDELGVVVQAEPLGFPLGGTPGEVPVTQSRSDPRIDVLVGVTSRPTPADLGEDAIVWRLPRPVRLWIWRRQRDGQPVLERTFPTLVVDEQSGRAWLIVSRHLFGETSGSLEFGELGMLTRIVHSEKGAAGIIADALTGVPGAISSGVESAKKTTDSFVGLLDAEEQRALDALKRRLEHDRVELDRKGLAATADDVARLKLLEQRVAIAEAEGKLAPASELEMLRAQLELVQVRAALRDTEADGDPATGATLEEQLAELQIRVEALERRD